MIGTRARGFRHLIRMAKALNETIFFFKYDHFNIGGGIAVYMDGSKYKNPFMSMPGDYVILFNDCFDNCKNNSLKYFEKDEIYKRLVDIQNKHYHIWVVPIAKSNFRDDYGYIHDIVVMPEDFEKSYTDFCEANKKQIPNLTRYCDINSSLAKYMFAISSGSKNFFFWAINAYFKNHISIFMIENILKWNDKYNQLQSKLKKGTITAYTSTSDFFALVREMTLLRRDKRANDVINSFNTAQKKILKNTKLTDRDYETLSKFGKLSQKKKSNFIKKMSTIEDPAEILKQMSFLADIHFEWNKQSFMDYYKNLENFNCEVVLEKGDIVLLKVGDYEAVKRLAKATNWCISKDKKYWNEYVEMRSDATQYVLFNFGKKEDDNLSIVGFTSVHDRGITHAHDFQNRNIMGSKHTKAVSEIKSFVSRFMDCSNIYGVLDKYGIDLSDVVTYDQYQYKWTREDMFDYLNRCVDEEDYYFIHDDGDKVALIVEDDNVRYFLGDAYIDNRHYNCQPGDQHIIFADFSKKQNDPEKLVFGVIHHNFSTHESSCDRLYNDRFETITQSFDSKLDEYGLPYDIICRTDNTVDRFYTALISYELSTVKELIKDKAVADDLKLMTRTGMIRDALVNVTFNMTSDNYLNLFYDNGYTLSNVIGNGFAADFGRRLINTICDNRMNPGVPTQKDIEKFKKGALGENYGTAFHIGYFLMLMKFIEKETDPDVISNITISILERHRRSDMFDLVLCRICDETDLNRNLSVLKFVLGYAGGNNSVSVINAVRKQKLTGKAADYARNTIEGFNVKSTEIWVKRDDNTYVLEGINEEAIAHAPRRR